MPANRIAELFEHNKAWSDRIKQEDPTFFEQLAKQQEPDFLWIGCSDSRVPANQLLGLMPGEVFVHRNVANQVLHTDINAHSVIQYAVEVLKVEHIIVCGHYGCGGVIAAGSGAPAPGVIDHWLGGLRDLAQENHQELNAITDPDERNNRLCELNVLAQLNNLGKSTTIQNAWKNGQPLALHGWIYSLADGRLKDLGKMVTGVDDLPKHQQLNLS